MRDFYFYFLFRDFKYKIGFPQNLDVSNFLTFKYVALFIVFIKLLLCLVTMHGAEFEMSTQVYHIAGLSSRISSSVTSLNNFQGRLQGLVVNGERILDEAHLKQIQYEGMNILKFKHILSKDLSTNIKFFTTNLQDEEHPRHN